ncbi:MAG: hypothetical protein SGJ02_01955 [bacterium]|nr:hypothetical protein [bacterium]
MSLLFASIPPKRLAFAITSASSTFILNNIKSFDGENDVAPSDLGTQHYVCFRNDTGTIAEFMEIDPATLIAGGPITIVRRGLNFYGNRTLETTALKLDFPANTIVQMGTDVPQIFQWLKEYIDAAAIAGGVPASTSALGFVNLSKTSATPSTPIVAGDNDPRLVGYAVDSVGTDSYAITPSPALTTYETGRIYSFKAGTANTGACTLNVSALGAKSIYKGVTNELDTGDILLNQIVVVQYDGTNFQLISTPSLTTKVTTFTVNGTFTKSALAKSIEVICIGAGGGGGSGRVSTDNTGCAGGGGGGGGAVTRIIIPSSSVQATETITVGVGGTGGAGVTISGAGTINGNAGSDGTASSFGTWLKAGGGGGGGGATNTSIGGGGGSFLNSASTSTGGAPTVNSASISGQGITATVSVAGFCSEYGGAGGGGNGTTGGSSIFACAGGGSGGSHDGNGSAGGTVQSYTAAGGGAGGAYNAGTTAGVGVAGTANATLLKGYGGSGGGGGGATDTSGFNGGVGGAGGAGGAGGGGGGAHRLNSGSSSFSGAGGVGGRGEVRVIEYF